MSRVVTITGGSGFVGQLLRPALRQAGWEVRVFDPLRGPLVDLLRHRHLAGARTPAQRRAAVAVRRGQVGAEAALRAARVVRPTADDILAPREQIARAFTGSQAVIHLAGIPHPHQPGATDADFKRLNYDASVAVFEAARDAGVATVVVASSAQVYGINDLRRIDRFPLLETNPLPLPAEGQTTYGFLKAALERYLDGACTTGTTQALALRLEFPGFRSTRDWNLWVSTSVENLVAGFLCALSPPPDLGFEAFNLCDGHVDPAIIDVQRYLRHRWPFVPNHTEGNQGLLSVEKARRLLGYAPRTDGRYVAAALVW